MLSQEQIQDALTRANLPSATPLESWQILFNLLWHVLAEIVSHLTHKLV